MIAEGLVDAGVSVVISSRDAAACTSVAARLSELGQCVAIPADLSKPAECQRLADEVMHLAPNLDILVNNAGATWGAPLLEYDEGAWERVLALNVKGVFHLTRALSTHLSTTGTPEHPARIINIGSIDGLRVPGLETYAYTASKAALHQLTRHLAGRLGPNVTVNAVAPGPFESRMMASTLELFGDQIIAESPLHRIGRPSDVAGVVIFLASCAGSYLTGAVIPVDGGIYTVGMQGVSAASTR